jgi:hypothetical protein
MLGLNQRSVIKFTAALNVETSLQKKRFMNDIRLLVDKKERVRIADVQAGATPPFLSTMTLGFVQIVM